MLDDKMIPETLEDCRAHFIPKNEEFITCKYFGDCQCNEGSSVWCYEMTPYQWHMCSDEQWVKNLMYPAPCHGAMTREQAEAFIEDYKQRCSKSNAE